MSKYNTKNQSVVCVVVAKGGTVSFDGGIESLEVNNDGWMAIHRNIIIVLGGERPVWI